MLNAGATPRTVYAISDLNEILRALIEDSLPSLWVQGEISNFSKPSSGHWYFTLKDEQAQIRCAMFRKANYYIRPLPQNGDAVLVRAKASVYPGRGELQLIVEHLEPAGTGALLRAFEELKQRLAAEGLFDSAQKRSIATAPRRIGLITSGTGAAVHDVLTTLARRWPLAEVWFCPVPVQGVDAPAAIVKALGLLSRSKGTDTVLLVRGGGSIEDLWAFNDEAVARAIRNCSVPVITGIGHEVDITIADLAADLRAPTPTAAAELATPDIAERGSQLDALLDALGSEMEWRLQSAGDALHRRQLDLQARHPGRRLQARAQKLDEFEQRMHRIIGANLQRDRQRLNSTLQRLQRVHPQFGLSRAGQTVAQLDSRLRACGRSALARHATRLAHSSAILASVNPQNVLNRGYAIVSDQQGSVLRDAGPIHVGQNVQVRLAHGSLHAKVETICTERAPEQR